ncbi:hypothetical protein KBTX_03162 [wastewater metagenome]|uniref:Uncharacterized protein n=2 Tax=unclassified sequences TaxID=12908 RepID=A0A5B8RE02_9ZZZZ|nr:hypothetical protein KBTEX_03162 [uncultured organism]
MIQPAPPRLGPSNKPDVVIALGSSNAFLAVIGTIRDLGGVISHE